MKSNLDRLKNQIHNFWEGFDKTDKKKLIKWVEIRNYKKAKTKLIKKNKLMI